MKPLRQYFHEVLYVSEKWKLELGEKGLIMVWLWVCMYIANKPSKQSTKGTKFAPNQICPLPKGGYKNKQARGKTHTHNSLSGVSFRTGMKRDELKSAILVFQVPEDFFARVKLGSLSVHVVLINFIIAACHWHGAKAPWWRARLFTVYRNTVGKNTWRLFKKFQWKFVICNWECKG